MLHEKIKYATTTDHHNAEKHSYGREIMSRTLTKSQYAQLLVANYSYIAPWEQQWNNIDGIDVSTLTLSDREKTSLLEQDLNSLGIDPTTIPLASIEVPTTYAQFMGRMYVIEGSTLGGAVIEKQLKLNPNLEGSSFHFYGGYGPNLMPFWKSFLAELNSVESEEAHTEAILWAKKCFNDMEQAFINAKTMSLHS